jgi:hypothetical protein
MPTEEFEDPTTPAAQWTDADWPDDFGLEERQFAVEDVNENADAPLPPAVAGPPPAPAQEGGDQGNGHAG